MDTTILDAIPGTNPSGENLRHELIYGEIRKRIRRARGEVFSHPGDLDYCSADEDWRFVARTCRDLLMRRSKDLMLAAWLIEAQLALDGLAGLQDGLDIHRGLLENFWETLYPEIEDGDIESRLRIFEWLDQQLAVSVEGVLAIYPKTDDLEGRRKRNCELDACIERLKTLEEACWKKFGDEGPVFAKLRNTLLGHLAGEDNLAALLADAEDLPVSESELRLIEIEKRKQVVEGLLEARRYDAALHTVHEFPESEEVNRLLDSVRNQIQEKRSAVSPPPRAPAPAMPASIVVREPQKVDFTLTAPAAVVPSVPFEIFIWAHESGQRSRVLARAREELGVRDVLARAKGPVKLLTGTVLRVQLRIPGAVIDESEDTMVWEGESTCASFVVTLPELSREAKCYGSAHIYANGVQIAKIPFLLSAAGTADIIEASGVRYKNAFASYASADRDAVLGRIQGIHKIAPELDVFLDVLSLRSGQNWETELWRVIPASDIFYLFWSTHARDSEWVEREWRCALRERGIEFIDPIPLESPQESPPPPELRSLHFNDWELAFRRSNIST
ncbi:type VI secretion system ImpA family N-terminal domain-containing protein [Alloacidobacterium sp.]|uniref:type VI secretion system ImpA family N-terminal domain-containing protein n=1 Tax=Alloacidobacterium sp. TaxID=2951999 RepID=UPI002D4FC878|nr:type VI secretion system ImpA family N-terminal domain-containing protein [Alloacidobacterium sp.]HYK36393.1 type VI secretion system ImpA family N-terminal domain-containing protein [Alloacidobacterium sp.]